MARPVVVLVEDDPQMQQMAKTVIAEMDSAESVVAEDVPHAISLVWEKNPALVIVDDDSPSGSAQRVMDNLMVRPETQFTPVVVLTNQPVWALTRLGVVVCLRKPVEAIDLAGMVKLYTQPSEVG